MIFYIFLIDIISFSFKTFYALQHHQNAICAKLEPFYNLQAFSNILQDGSWLSLGVSSFGMITKEVFHYFKIYQYKFDTFDSVYSKFQNRRCNL